MVTEPAELAGAQAVNAVRFCARRWALGTPGALHRHKTTIIHCNPKRCFIPWLLECSTSGPYASSANRSSQKTQLQRSRIRIVIVQDEGRQKFGLTTE